MSSYLLLIETATTNCSIALAKPSGERVHLVEKNEANFRHSDHLHLFIERCIEEAGITINQLSGVGVSMGPGSYTGLRIGVASAKGICYANDIPLMAVNTLDVLARQCQTEKLNLLIPMLDARRMEIFTKVLSADFKEIQPTTASIVDESFVASLPQGKKYIFGSGAEKCKPFMQGEEFVFCDDIRVPSANDMVDLIAEKYKQEAFEDVAYFDPYYLKDFYTTAKKKVD